MIRQSAKNMEQGTKSNQDRTASAAGSVPVVSNSFSLLASPVASWGAGSMCTQDDRSPSSRDQSCTALSVSSDKAMRTQEDFQQLVTSSLQMIIKGQNDLRKELDCFKREISQTVEWQGDEMQELKNTSKEIKTVNDKQWDRFNQTTNYVTDLFNKFERYRRKNNLRIVSYPETEGENINTIVSDIFAHKFKLVGIEFERAHRNGKLYKGHGGSTTRPRHIIVKLLRFSDKVTILKTWRDCLKNEEFRMTDDLTKLDLEEKKRWQHEVSDLYKKGEKHCFVNGVWRNSKGQMASFYTVNSSFKIDSPKPGLAERVCVNVPHLIQSTSWDCGLACAKMVLRYLYKDYTGDENNFDQICQELGINTGAWTIDLTHIVNEYGIKHHFYTQTLGVDPSYQNVGFYKQVMSFNNEEKRVNALFDRVAEKNIKVEKRGVTKEEILRHLSTENPIIILIDAAVLQCTTCYYLPHMCIGDGCLAMCCTGRRTYQGHFIVLIGYDMTTQEYLYRNPSNSQDLCHCTFDNLEDARMAHGTDEDILFIYR